MGIKRLLLVVLLASACGSVKATSDGGVHDGPQEGTPDAPGCAPGTCGDGHACTAAADCASGNCECGDATCSAKVCSPVTCACGFNSTGGPACDGYVAAGHDDATDSCGASACDGTGACGLPLLWYKFDEPAGTGAAANSGTLPGQDAPVTGTQGAPGILGSAIQLQQGADGITIADPTDGSLDAFTSWTAEGWVNFSALPLDDYATLVKKDGGYICRIPEGAGCPDCYVGQALVLSPNQQVASAAIPAPATGTWYHVACTYDGATGTLAFYLNGSLLASSGGGGGALADSAAALGVGEAPGGNESLEGLLDDFKLWNTTRDARQICLDACGTYAGTTCTFDGSCAN